MTITENLTRELKQISLQNRASTAKRMGAVQKRFAFTKDDFSNDFAAGSLSADAAQLGEQRIMRDRVRVIGRKNGYFRKYLRNCRKNVIGKTGIMLEPVVFTDKTQTTRDPVREGIALKGWERFGTEKWCTVTEAYSWYEVQNLVVNTVQRDGECLVRIVPWPDSPFGFRLQLMEGDHLDEMYNVAPTRGQNRVVMGVEKDPWGKIIAYHILTNHPYDYISSGFALERRRIRLLADEIIHIYDPERIGQSRGFPGATCVVTRLGHIDGYEEAEVIASRAAACKTAVITKTSENGWQGNEDDQGVVPDETRPGETIELPVGMMMNPVDWKHPNTNYKEFRSGVLQGVASGLNVSYNFLASDLVGVSYSSLRSGAMDEQDTWINLQEFYIAVLHMKVLEAFYDNAPLYGGLPLAGRDENGFSLDEEDQELLYGKPIWHPPRWGWPDPKNDAQADALLVANGFKSRSSIIRENTGRNPEEVYKEMQWDNEQAAKYGLVFVATTTTPNGTVNTNAEDPPAETTDTPTPEDAPTARDMQPVEMHAHFSNHDKVIVFQKNEDGEMIGAEVREMKPEHNGHALRE